MGGSVVNDRDSPGSWSESLMKSRLVPKLISIEQGDRALVGLGLQ